MQTSEVGSLKVGLLYKPSKCNKEEGTFFRQRLEKIKLPMLKSAAIPRNGAYALTYWHYPGGQNWISSFPHKRNRNLVLAQSLAVLTQVSAWSLSARTHRCTIFDTLLPKAKKKMTSPKCAKQNHHTSNWQKQASDGQDVCLGGYPLFFSRMVESPPVRRPTESVSFPRKVDYASNSQLIHWEGMWVMPWVYEVWTSPTRPSSSSATSRLCSPWFRFVEVLPLIRSSVLPATQDRSWPSHCIIRPPTLKSTEYCLRYY